jgi:hypothetical protein
MHALLVVEGDVVAQGLSKLLVVSEGLAVQLLGLHRMEERFHVCVVHLASSVHVLQHAQSGDLIAELQGGVFDAAVA